MWQLEQKIIQILRLPVFTQKQRDVIGLADPVIERAEAT